MRVPTEYDRGFAIKRRKHRIGGPLYVSNNDFVDCWPLGGRMFYFTDNRTVEIFSSSAQDNPAGTGAYEIQIEYLDENYIENEIKVTLNGTTPVIQTGIMRVNNIYVTKANDDGTGRFRNAGNITVRDQSSTETMAFMIATTNTGASCHYTVPDNYYAYIDTFFGDGNLPETICTSVLAAKRENEIFRIESYIVTGLSVTRDLDVFLPPRSDIIARVRRPAGSTVTSFTAGYSLSLVPKVYTESLYARESLSPPV